MKTSVTDLHIGQQVKLKGGSKATVTAEPVNTGNETLLTLDGNPRWVPSDRSVSVV